MKNFKLSERSIKRLAGVAPELFDIVMIAIENSKVDFGVLEGVRSVETQLKYLAEKKSKTAYSMHLIGAAVDLFAWVDGKLTWEWEYYELINEAMQEAAAIKGTRIVWGGNWMTFKDGVHFQLVRTPEMHKQITDMVSLHV